MPLRELWIFSDLKYNDGFIINSSVLDTERVACRWGAVCVFLFFSIYFHDKNLIISDAQN